jgi:hypothetical protein
MLGLYTAGTGPLEWGITREAFEQHFWLPPRVGEARVPRALSDGCKRIGLF